MRAFCAGEYSSCKSAPESLGFDDLSPQAAPLTYRGLNFTASSNGQLFAQELYGLPGTILLVSFSPNFDDQGNLTAVSDGSVSIMDSGTAAGGAFNAISISLETFDSVNFFNVSGVQNGTVNPFCQQSFSLDAASTSASLLKVSLGVNGGACVADDLFISTQFKSDLYGTVAVVIDNFVVCKANELSGLLP